MGDFHFYSFAHYVSTGMVSYVKQGCGRYCRYSQTSDAILRLCENEISNDANESGNQETQ